MRRPIVEWIHPTGLARHPRHVPSLDLPRVWVWVHGTGGRAEEEHARLRPVIEREASGPVRLVCPQFDTPYQFLLPDADVRLLAWLAERGIEGPICIGGMSGGGQFAHRFTLRHPERVCACAAFAAGAWTTPEGRSIGMMADEDWFSRAPWDGPGIREASQVPAVAGWERVRWMLGCGHDDHPSRLSSTLQMLQMLGQAKALVSYRGWRGGHDGPPADVLADMVRWFEQPSVPAPAEVARDVQT